MKIDKKTFIELLVQKTGLKPDEVEKQFQELTDRIIAASKRGKALEIKGFGMFYFNKHKELTFEPAEEFKTEVNFKYAGMEPVEVQPESKTDSEADDSVSESAADSDNVFGIEDEETQAGASAKPEVETKSSGRKKKKSTSDQTEKEKREPTIDVFGKDEESDEAFFENLIEDPQEQAKKRGKKELKKAGTAPKGSGKTKKTGPSKPPSRTAAKKKDPITVVMLVMLAFFGLAGILFAITYFTSDDAPTPDVALESAPPVAPVPAEQDATEPDDVPEEPVVDGANDATSEVEPPIEQETEAITPPEPEPAGEVYGLMGDVITEANDGYTIVLHSLRSLANAREAAADLRDNNYRTIVTERVVNAQTVYRVGVGQFPSIDEALSMARTLPAPYNSQHFIQRIQ